MALRDGGALTQKLRLKELAEHWLPGTQLARLTEDAHLLDNRRRSRELPSGVDPYQLSQTGWGVIFSDAEVDRGAQGHLAELLALRKSQAKELYYLSTFSGTDNARQFLYSELSTSPGTIDPAKIPYYLLLVGSPEQIPFEMQYALSVNHAVGRVHFKDVKDYGHYAKAVVAAEGSTIIPRPRRVSLFAVEKPGDEASTQMADFLVDPLARELPEKAETWALDLFRGDRGSREELLGLLQGGEQTPSVLIAACHGRRKAFAQGNQRAEQGSLICLDGSVSGKDLQILDPKSRPLFGLIAFLAACYSAGTPLLDGFPQERPESEVLETDLDPIAEQSFLADLPKKLLSRGTLAVVGHVDRGWTASFRWHFRGQPSPAARSFEDSVVRLLNGHRLGHALRPLSRRASAIGAHLLPMLEAVRNQLEVHLGDLRSHWTAFADARGYVLIGDPAVHAANQPPPPSARNDQSRILEAAQPVYLEPELAAKIRRLAKEEGVDPNRWIHKSLERQLNPGTHRHYEGRVFRDGRRFRGSD